MKTKIAYITVDDSVIDSGDISAVIEPVWWLGNIYEDYATYEQSLAQFSQEQRLVFAIFWYQAEVDNGGHDQFYFNPTGIVWHDALQGLAAIGNQAAFNVLKESIKRLGGTPSYDREIRCQQLEANQLGFDDLDDEFYKIDLSPHLKTYVNNNRGAFYFKGMVEKPILL